MRMPLQPVPQAPQSGMPPETACRPAAVASPFRGAASPIRRRSTAASAGTPTGRRESMCNELNDDAAEKQAARRRSLAQAMHRRSVTDSPRTRRSILRTALRRDAGERAAQTGVAI